MAMTLPNQAHQLRVAEIRQRLKDRYNGTATIWSHEDIDYLLSEVDRLEQAQIALSEVRRQIEALPRLMTADREHGYDHAIWLSDVLALLTPSAKERT